MSTTIYHNPRCSKSREALKILEDNNIEPLIVYYLETPPSATELLAICKILNIRANSLYRTKEKLFKELELSPNDSRSEEEWCEILSTHPKLIERPIVLHKGKGVIARPPELLLSVFNLSN